MDIRTKLVFALVGVTLASMLALGTVTYREARTLLRDSTRQRLEGLAESRRQDLEKVVLAWSDRVRLIGSRTQLRANLSSYLASHAVPERDGIVRILDDARRSVRSVDALSVFDVDGHLVGSSWGDHAPGPGLDLPPPDILRTVAPDIPKMLTLSVGEDGRRQVDYLFPLALEGARIGWLTARLGADELIDLSRDPTGLGEKGETLIIRRGPDGPELLHPTRQGAATTASPPRSIPGDSVDLRRLAIAGRDTVVLANARDQNGHPIWAAIRYLDDPGWGIVVKVDADEVSLPINTLRSRMTRLALSLSAFAILVGVLLALHIARPIHELSAVANRIRQGETGARAVIRHEDEVGVLARTFNLMADTLTQGRLTLVEQRAETPGDPPAHDASGADAEGSGGRERTG
jgi:HAMP domain-containing protein